MAIPELPTLKVEVDFSQDATWTDIAAYVKDGTIQRGVSRFDGVIARAEAGTASVTLANDDARFDPTNLSGPYVSGGVTQVKPRREWRIRATYNAITYPLWRGFAEQWKPHYLAYGTSSVTSLNGIDGASVFSRVDGITPVGTAGDTTGLRLERICDQVGWEDALQDIDLGLTTIRDPVAGNAWNLALLVTDTELGELYFAADGTLTFRDRRARSEEERSQVSQATFSNTGTGLPYSGIEVAYDTGQMFNSVSISRVGGSTQSVQDFDSIDEYLTKTYVRTDLEMQTDSEALLHAGYVLSLSKEPELRFDSITINPLSDPAALFPEVLAREFGDRITVILRPPGRTDTIERDCFIRGINHTFTGDSWITTWALQDATRFAVLTFDDAVNGRFDYGKFEY